MISAELINKFLAECAPNQIEATVGFAIRNENIAIWVETESMTTHFFGKCPAGSGTVEGHCHSASYHLTSDSCYLFILPGELRARHLLFELLVGVSGAGGAPPIATAAMDRC